MLSLYGLRKDQEGVVTEAMVTIAWPPQELEGLLFPLPALKPPLSCLQLILLSQLITTSLFETNKKY